MEKMLCEFMTNSSDSCSFGSGFLFKEKEKVATKTRK